MVKRKNQIQQQRIKIFFLFFFLFLTLMLVCYYISKQSSRNSIEKFTSYIKKLFSKTPEPKMIRKKDFGRNRFTDSVSDMTTPPPPRYSKKQDMGFSDIEMKEMKRKRPPPSKRISDGEFIAGETLYKKQSTPTPSKLQPTKNMNVSDEIETTLDLDPKKVEEINNFFENELKTNFYARMFTGYPDVLIKNKKFGFEENAAPFLLDNSVISKNYPNDKKKLEAMLNQVLIIANPNVKKILPSLPNQPPVKQFIIETRTSIPQTVTRKIDDVDDVDDGDFIDYKKEPDSKSEIISRFFESNDDRFKVNPNYGKDVSERPFVYTEPEKLDKTSVKKLKELNKSVENQLSIDEGILRKKKISTGKRIKQAVSSGTKVISDKVKQRNKQKVFDKATNMFKKNSFDNIEINPKFLESDSEPLFKSTLKTPTAENQKEIQRLISSFQKPIKNQKTKKTSSTTTNKKSDIADIADIGSFLSPFV